MKGLVLFVFGCLIFEGFAAEDCSWLKRRLDDEKRRQQPHGGIIDSIYPYDKDLEILMNLHIKNEMNAFYSYLSMAHFFGTEKHDLEGFYSYFHAAAMEELKHAEAFMKYQANRGGKNHLYSLSEPTKQFRTNGQYVLEAAFELEKKLTDEILCLHKMAEDDYGDVDLVNFLETDIIPEQFTSMKELKSHIKSIERLGGSHKNYGLAEFEYDKKFKEMYKK